MTTHYDREGTRQRRNGLPRVPAVTLGDALRPDRGIPVRAAVPVLLDGDDLVQVERGADVEGGEPLLDRQADARSFREAAVPHRVPAMALEHDPHLGIVDVHLAVRGSARRLRHRAAAVQGLAPGRAVDLLRLPRPAVDPVHPARAHRVQAGAVRLGVGAHPHLSHVPDTVLHLAAHGVFPHHSVRAGRMRPHRRGDALADPGEDHAAAGGAGTDLGRDFRLHAVVERVHLRAHLHLVIGEQDGAGRCDHRARRRRRLSLGRAHGGRAARFAARGDSLFVLRRVLRLGHDGRGKRMNSLDFKGRTAVVTGGLQGIGAAIAKRLKASGARIRVWDAAAKTGAVDVADAAAVESATAKAVADLGKIDVLVNNAGVAGLNVPTVDYPIEEWERVLKVNLTSQFLCCRSVAPHMVKRKYGRIVNIASIAGKEGNPNAVAYSASKAGVIALTKSLGKELARTGVLVNCVTPAAAKTAIFDQMTQEHIDYMLSKIPMNRFVTVDEIASLVCWVASEECSFSTGAVFDISGGRATY